jgi:hypothetical protein
LDVRDWWSLNRVGKRPHVTTAVAPGPSLTAEDRCDRCGAQAYIRVELNGGSELLFCAHHGREHADKLRTVALHIHDETNRLDETPGSAALEER